MKQIFTFLTIMMFAFTLNAQYIYNDFDGNQNETFLGDPNTPAVVANPDASGINTTTNVAEWVRGEGQWAHVYADLDGKIDFSTVTTFQLKVYSPIACEVLFKLEDKENAGTSVEVMGNVTTPNEWQLITYDFSGTASGVYDKIVIFFDFATTTDNTFYFDDVEGPEYVTGGPSGDVDLPVTFDDETINYGLTDFGGNMSEIIVDPSNPDNNIAQSIKTDAAELWAGTTVGGTVGFTAPIPFAEGSTSMSVAVMSPTIGTPIRLKVEDAGDPTKSVETEAMTTVENAWEVLAFDFSNEATGTAEINFGYTYNKASIFFNFGTDGATAGEQTYYWDDMEFVGGSTEPTVAAPVPTQDAADVVSIYSDTYTDLAGTDFNPGWGQSTVVTTEDISGNEMMKYASFNYQGTQLAENQDLSLMEFMHIDIWTADATVVKVTPISATTGEFLYELTPLAQGSWNSYDIPVGDFTGVSMADIHQLKFDGQAGVSPSNIYLDNIYFYKSSATEPTTAAPTPTDDAADVVSIYSDTYTDLAGTDFNPGWGQSTVVTTEDISGNEMMKYANFNYQGTQLDDNQDLSMMEYMHVDIWTADATVVKVTPISATTGEFLYELTPLAQGSWNSYDIPVGDFTGVSMADIHQLKFDGQAGVSPSNIYLDNIYFYKVPSTATEPTVAAPAPTQDAADIVSIYSDTYTDLADTDFNPGWGQSTVVTTEDISGNEMMKYASFNYQGTQLDGNQDLSMMEYMHVDIWTADATVIKVTPISATTGEFLVSLTPLNQGSWNSYDIPVTDFTGVSMGDIHQLKFDGQAGVSPSNIYLDNIYFYKLPPTEPTIAAPIPTEDAADVVSIYSDTYTDLAGTNFNPGWGQSTVVTTEDISGNEMMKYASFNYQGTQLAENQDLSLMEFMHIDIWTADATVIKVTPISATTGEFLYELTPLAQGSWNSYDIPVGDFTGVSMADIHQLKFDGQAGVSPSNIYLDNIYFYKTPTASGSDATLSDLQVDGTTVSGFSPNVLSYSIELPNGTTVVPTVTATTTDTNATEVITDATELPGTTSVVVTAEDDVTILTYSVNFTLADPVPTVGAPMPTHDEVNDNVSSIYSDSYTNLANTNFNPNWGQSTQVFVDEQIGGNNTLVYSNFNYQGTNLGSADGSPQDFTGHDYFHIDFWTPDASAINFFLISQSTGEISYPLSITQEQWVSVDIPLSHFTDAGMVLTDIYQFKLDGGDGSVTAYLDNWYFWTVPENGDATLSDLRIDGTPIDGFSPDVFNYDVELADGTTNVPIVWVATSDPSATFVINNATSLPGTTEVVVTAEDGLTSLTYYVNFVFPEPFPQVAAPNPTQDATDVISMFSDAYNDVAVDSWRTDWSDGVLEEVMIDGNAAKKYSQLNFVGIETVGENLIDASSMTHFHIDIWTPDTNDFKIKLVDFGADGEYGGGDDSEHELTYSAPSTEVWISYDIPLTDFTNLLSTEHIAQLILVKAPLGIIFVDNVFYYDDIVGVQTLLENTINVFPNPVTYQLNIQLTKNIVCEAQICDLRGLVLNKFKLNDSNSVIDMSALKSGIYILRVRNVETNELFVKKIIVRN